MKDLKKNFTNSEASLEVQGKWIKQLDEGAEDQYIVGYLWARLNLLRAFRDGKCVLADVDTEIAMLAEYMSDSEEEAEPKDATGEIVGALDRLEEVAAKSEEDRTEEKPTE